MKRSFSTFSLVTVISLLLVVIWLSPAFAVAPSFLSLGQIEADSLRVPGAMDLDGSGNLYVADNRGGRVHKFSPYGQLLEDFPLQASGSGLAVTPDGQRLYVTRQQSVLIVDANTGEELGSLTGSGDPEFYVAGEIELDANGNVYVVDAGSMKIKIYDASGQYQAQFGGFGLTAGTFKKIGAMTINPAGQVVVADSSALNAQIHVFSDVFSVDTGLNLDNVTVFLNTNFGIPVMSSPGGLTFDANGRGFFLESIHSDLRVTDANFAYLGAYTNADSPDPEVGQLNNLIDAVFDDSNNRLFVGCDSGRIEIFGLDGTGTNPVKINHAPSKPVHLSPVDGSEVASSTPTLVFNNSTDEDGDSLTYHVIVSRSGVSVFETDVEEQASGTTSMVVGVALEENATYSWTVQATDGDDVSEVSDAVTFLVNAVPDNHAPTMPVLQSPVAGSEVTSVTPTLVFNNSTDEDGDSLTYHVIVSLAGESVFATDVEAQASSTTSVLVGVALEENTTYSWTVQAADGVDVSEVSPAAAFVVNAVEEAPGPPELLAPADNASIAGADLLSWTEPDDDPDPNDYISGYQVEIAADEAFVDVLMTQSLDTNELELKALQDYSLFEDGAVYFWRVTAQDSELVSSPAGPARRFVYDTTVLTVTANMADAVVSFSGNHAYSGQVVGATPFELRDFEPGTLSVVVTHAGFEPFVANVALAESANVELYAKLVPAMTVDNLSVSRNGINGKSGLFVGGDAVPFLVDFDNDGDLDLLVSDASGQVSLFSNMQIDGNNGLLFDAGVSLGLPVMSSSVLFVADWDNDGRKDLIIGQSDGSVKLFANVGTEISPSFGSGVDVLTGAGILSVGAGAAPVVVDYDRDGAKDLLIGNQLGQVQVCLNQGTDASPQLAEPVVVLQAEGAVVPFPVDWDENGSLELLLTVDGIVTVYAQVEGQYQPIQVFGKKGDMYRGVFPIALQGEGKQFLVGQTDGEVVFMSGNNNMPVASFFDALQLKVDELDALVELEAPELMSDVAAIAAEISAADYKKAYPLVNDLTLALPVGLAQVSAFELSDLLVPVLELK